MDLDAADNRFLVAVNDEEQYSIWFEGKGAAERLARDRVPRAMDGAAT